MRQRDGPRWRSISRMKCTLSGTWNDSSRARMVSMRATAGSRGGASERDAIGRRADHLEHQVGQHDGLEVARAGVGAVEEAGHATDGPHLAADVPEEAHQQRRGATPPRRRRDAGTRRAPDPSCATSSASRSACVAPEYSATQRRVEEARRRRGAPRRWRSCTGDEQLVVVIVHGLGAAPQRVQPPRRLARTGVPMRPRLALSSRSVSMGVTSVVAARSR